MWGYVRSRGRRVFREGVEWWAGALDPSRGLGMTGLRGLGVAGGIWGNGLGGPRGIAPLVPALGTLRCSQRHIFSRLPPLRGPAVGASRPYPPLILREPQHERPPRDGFPIGVGNDGYGEGGGEQVYEWGLGFRMAWRTVWAAVWGSRVADSTCWTRSARSGLEEMAR